MRNQEHAGPSLRAVASVSLPTGTEHCITVDAEEHGCLHQRLRDALADLRATPLQQFVFGGCRHYPAYRDALASAGVPTTWLQGDACRSGEMLSLQALAVSDMATTPVRLNDTLVGSWYEDAHARYCHLGGILPADPAASREEQARSVFDRLAQALATCGMTFTHSVRTWFYLDRLLEWYDTFNRVRTDFFNAHGTFDHVVPASTGIGAGNPFGCALAAGLIAVQPRAATTLVRAVSSPLQCAAESYHSSFSRAVEVERPTHRTLYLSGTASIDHDGRTRHTGDPVGQIRQTMKVVDALLVSRSMSWDHVVRGVAYFKDIRRDRGLYEAYCTRQRIPSFPLAVSHADVCRHDLLFEIEVDAVRIGDGAV